MAVKFRILLICANWASRILFINVHRIGREYSHRLWISAFYRINHKKSNLESLNSVKMLYFRHPASFPILCASPFYTHTRNKKAPCLQKCCRWNWSTDVVMRFGRAIGRDEMHTRYFDESDYVAFRLDTYFVIWSFCCDVVGCRESRIYFIYVRSRRARCFPSPNGAHHSRCERWSR